MSDWIDDALRRDSISYYEKIDARTNTRKYWSCRYIRREPLDDGTPMIGLEVAWGRIDTEGQTKVLDTAKWLSAIQAARAVREQEKLASGYRDMSGWFEQQRTAGMVGKSPALRPAALTPNVNADGWPIDERGRETRPDDAKRRALEVARRRTEVSSRRSTADVEALLSVDVTVSARTRKSPDKTEPELPRDRIIDWSD